jgi:hypothetical protein
MAKAKGGGKLHRLLFTTFGEIAALGLEVEVHCSSCYRQTKVDPADRRSMIESLPRRRSAAVGMRDHGFAVPLQSMAPHGGRAIHTPSRQLDLTGSCVKNSLFAPWVDSFLRG